MADRVRTVELEGAGEGGPGEVGGYRPPAAMQRRVRARDQACRFPGCRRRAGGCDVDHTVPYPLGRTSPCTLACLCRSHHRLEHRGGWQVRQLGRGRLRWTSPAGRVTTTDPPAWCRAGAAVPEVVLRT